MQFLLADEYATNRLEEAADLACQVLRGAGEGAADRMVVVVDHLSDLGEANPLSGVDPRMLASKAPAPGLAR
jgi:hypothetical protein